MDGVVWVVLFVVVEVGVMHGAGQSQQKLLKYAQPAWLSHEYCSRKALQAGKDPEKT